MKKFYKRLAVLAALWLVIGVPLRSQPQQNQNVTVTFGLQIGPGHKATLTWVASVTSGVLSYNVYRSVINGSAYTKIGSTTAPTVTYVDGGLPAGNTYYYVVTAVSLGGESSFSNQVTGVVPTP